MIYAIMTKARLMLCLLLVPLFARGDISGSTVEMEAPFNGKIPIGGLVEFRFEVTNLSTDLNWIANLIFEFPDCCSVLFMRFDDSQASNAPWAFEYDGIGTSTARYLDADGAYGEIPGNGEHGWFMVTIRASEDCPESLGLVNWILEGDALGAEPHTINGSIPVEFLFVPVEETSFSTIKSGY